MTHAKFNFNQLMLTMIFGIRASEPPRTWRTTEKAGPDRVKLSGLPTPHITTKEYNMMLKVFDVVSTIYDKYKPKGRKSFLNYSFVLKQILIMRGMDQYAKYIPKLKTHSKQKELELVWELITKDPEWAVALRKRKIS